MKIPSVFKPLLLLSAWLVSSLAFATSCSYRVPVMGLSVQSAVASVSPTSLTFSGAQGTSFSPQNVTVTNSGSGTLSVTGITQTYGQYFPVSNGCTSGLSAGQSCTISVDFAPSAAGTYSDTLTIATNQAGSTAYSVSLSGTSTASGSDPYFASVTALLPLDGANGSTTVTDVKGGSYSLASGASLSTSTLKFGTASLNLGSGYLMGPSAGCTFGGNDFTVEMWVNLPTTDGNAPVFFESRPGAGANGPYFYLDGNGVYANANYIIGWKNPVPKDGNWHLIAYSRVSGVGTLYLDGQADGSGSDATSYTCNGFGVGYNVNGIVTDGFYVDDLRITNGVGRYTASFTPPTGAFPTN